VMAVTLAGRETVLARLLRGNGTPGGRRRREGDAS
jgi:hypothetical protein